MSRYDMRLVEENPNINKRRSFIPNLKHKSQLDFNAGLLVPMDRPWEVLPGDTWKVKHNLKIRMTNPPKVPTFDLLVFDLFYWYTPLRCLWTNFDKFITGDTGTDWTRLSDLTLPKITFDGETVTGSLMDYLGLYTNINDSEAPFNALPFRNYYFIYNEYFRYQSLQPEVYIDFGDDSTDVSRSDVSSYVTQWYHRNASGVRDQFDVVYDAIISNGVETMMLCPVNKLSDVYSRCLPQPLAGPDVSILGLGLDISNPVSIGNFGVTGDKSLMIYGSGLSTNYQNLVTDNNYGSGLGSSGIVSGTSEEPITGLSGTLKGLGLNVSGNTINDLIQAMAINTVLTIDARYGRRIQEHTLGFWDVVVPDYRVDIPEELVRHRIYMNMNQVVQSSSSVENSPQGNVGAWSETIDNRFDFIKSFVEHGLIQCCGCVRILNRTYSQGTDKLFTKNSRFDFYLPPLANISDQPVYQSELFSTNETVGEVFGYQEAWYEYKYLPNHVAGHCRPTASNTLAVWNYADSFATAPEFDMYWIQEDPTPIDRTMYLQSSATVSQFIVDIIFDIEAYRTMPLHSKNGLDFGW